MGGKGKCAFDFKFTSDFTMTLLEVCALFASKCFLRFLPRLMGIMHRELEIIGSQVRLTIVIGSYMSETEINDVC